jgi:hypothetical protein
MKDQTYPNRTFRAEDITWEELKRQRKLSGLSWNLFLKHLLDLYKSSSNGTEQ